MLSAVIIIKCFLAVIVESVNKFSTFQGFRLQSRESAPEYNISTPFAGQFIKRDDPESDSWKIQTCSGVIVNHHNYCNE